MLAPRLGAKAARRFAADIASEAAHTPSLVGRAGRRKFLVSCADLALSDHGLAAADRAGSGQGTIVPGSVTPERLRPAGWRRGRRSRRRVGAPQVRGKITGTWTPAWRYAVTVALTTSGLYVGSNPASSRRDAMTSWEGNLSRTGSAPTRIQRAGAVRARGSRSRWYGNLVLTWYSRFVLAWKGLPQWLLVPARPALACSLYYSRSTTITYRCGSTPRAGTPC